MKTIAEICMKSKVLHLILTLSVFLSVNTVFSASTNGQKPFGPWIYGVGVGEGSTAASEKSQKPFYSGAFVTVTWDDIEPTKGNFTWTSFDKVVGDCANGK